MVSAGCDGQRSHCPIPNAKIGHDVVADCAGAAPHWPHKPGSLVQLQDPLWTHSSIGRALGC